MKRLLIRALIGIIISLLTLEGLLRFVDPWGVVHSLDEFNAFFANVREDSTLGYRMLPGQYQYSTWRATINADGWRNVPGTSIESCTIAIVGDSMAFGWGVNDDQTWPALLAKQLPSVHFINTGVPGYNVDNVYAVITHVQADAYVYLLVYNDAEPPPDIVAWRTPSGMSALKMYLLFSDPVQVMQREPASDYPAFWRTFANIEARSDVQVVAFDEPRDELGKETAARYPVILIPTYTHMNSHADVHPNADGNQQIAAAMLPIAQKLTKEKCGG